MEQKNKILSVSKDLHIRFSEVNSSGAVSHGFYAIYFEDAREAFGAKYKLEYLKIAEFGFFAPLVQLSFNFIKPITYSMHPRIEITYVPTEAAKIVFDYKIFDNKTGELLTTGRSIQVFLDFDYQLVWATPEFYNKWKAMWGLPSES